MPEMGGGGDDGGGGGGVHSAFRSTASWDWRFCFRGIALILLGNGFPAVMAPVDADAMRGERDSGRW